jgi:hypothetical protein
MNPAEKRRTLSGQRLFSPRLLQTRMKRGLVVSRQPGVEMHASTFPYRLLKNSYETFQPHSLLARTSQDNHRTLNWVK